MLLLLAELTAKPPCAGQVESILRNLVEITRDEPGSIVYALHQSEDDSHRFMLYELYKNRDACNAHLARRAVKEALEQVQPLLAAPPEIQFYKVVSAAGIGTGGADAGIARASSRSAADARPPGSITES